MRRWGFDPLDAFAKTIEKCANMEGDDNHEEEASKIAKEIMLSKIRNR